MFIANIVENRKIQKIRRNIITLKCNYTENNYTEKENNHTEIKKDNILWHVAQSFAFLPWPSSIWI